MNGGGDQAGSSREGARRKDPAKPTEAEAAAGDEPKAVPTGTEGDEDPHNEMLPVST